VICYKILSGSGRVISTLIFMITQNESGCKRHSLPTQDESFMTTPVTTADENEFRPGVG
jgi:hypothetical protein